jgi:hypothetical protein
MILQPDSTAVAEAAVIRGEDIPKAPQSPEDTIILGIVLQNVRECEAQYRRQNLANKWNDSKALYDFYVREQTWTGTRLKRSSLGVPLVLEHVDSIAAQVMDVMWEEDPPFYPVPYHGTPPNQARAAVELQRWMLEKSEAEAEIDEGVSWTLLQGTGVWKAYWIVKDGYKCPKLEYVEREHIFVDPSLRRHDIRKAKWVAHRMFMSIEAIDKLRNLPGYKNIPPLEELRKLATHPQETPAPPSIERDAEFNLPEFDVVDRSDQTSAHPMHHKLEVLEYMDHTHVWTVFQQKTVIRAADNRKRDKVEYFSAFAVRNKGQFDGKGFGELIGGEQTIQQVLTNSMLDNLALMMHGMFKYKRGSTLFPQQIKVQPGLVIPVDDVNDFDAVNLPGIKSEVFQAINDSEQRAMRRTGANEVTVQGSFPESSGGIGRTAAGMNALAQAAGLRIRKFVKILERQVFIPFLEFCQRTAPRHLTPEFVEFLLGSELAGAYTEGLTGQDVLGAKMKFKFLAATKMKRRSAMIGSVPILLEFFQQPAVQDAIKGQMSNLNFNELIWMMFDATGWPNKSTLITPMSQEEQMKVMSENTLIQEMLMAKMNLKMKSDADIKVVDAKNAGIAFRDILKAMLEDRQTADGMRQSLMEMMGQMAGNKQVDSMMGGGLPGEMMPPGGM